MTLFLPWTLLFSLVPLVGSGQTTPRAEEEIRASVPPVGECDQTRELTREVRFPAAGPAKVIVTIHGHDRCWTDRMVLWQREGDGFEPFAELDEGRAGAELFRFEGRQFLFLTQSQPSAGREWTGYLVVFVTDDGDLQFVEFDGETDCDTTLPPIGSRFEYGYGGYYTFQDDDLRFAWNLWNRDDSPNFPTGGYVRGALSIVEDPDTPSGLAIVAESCDRTPGR